MSVAPVTPDNLACRLDELFPARSEDERAQGSNWRKLPVRWRPGATSASSQAARVLARPPLWCACWACCKSRRSSGKPLRIRLAAPTGKAAARLSESIGKEVRALPVSDAVRAEIPTDVSTLHRLLGSRPNSRNFIHQRDKPLELDVLVVDEASMIDLEMMACVLDALPEAARLILLGDKDQLASVEAGSVMGDLCREAEKGDYNAQTAQWLSTHSGEALLDPELQMAEGLAPLAQQTVMLRRSWRFDPQKGIGRLAKLINKSRLAKHGECSNSHRSNFSTWWYVASRMPRLPTWPSMATAMPRLPALSGATARPSPSA